MIEAAHASSPAFCVADRRPYRLLGCYLDSTDRDLNKAAVMNGRMSIEICYRTCYAKRYPYFSVQNGNSCFCGRHFGRYGKRATSECNKRCNADSKQYCGGSYRNMVFRIKAVRGESLCSLPEKRFVCWCTCA
jgi:hypothetical protein